MKLSITVAHPSFVCKYGPVRQERVGVNKLFLSQRYYKQNLVGKLGLKNFIADLRISTDLDTFVLKKLEIR